MGRFFLVFFFFFLFVFLVTVSVLLLLFFSFLLVLFLFLPSLLGFWRTITRYISLNPQGSG